MSHTVLYFIYFTVFRNMNCQIHSCISYILVYHTFLYLIYFMAFRMMKYHIQSFISYIVQYSEIWIVTYILVSYTFLYLIHSCISYILWQLEWWSVTYSLVYHTLYGGGILVCGQSWMYKLNRWSKYFNKSNPTIYCFGFEERKERGSKAFWPLFKTKLRLYIYEKIVYLAL